MLHHIPSWEDQSRSAGKLSPTQIHFCCNLAEQPCVRRAGGAARGDSGALQGPTQLKHSPRKNPQSPRGLLCWKRAQGWGAPGAGLAFLRRVLPSDLCQAGFLPGLEAEHQGLPAFAGCKQGAGLSQNCPKSRLGLGTQGQSSALPLTSHAASAKSPSLGVSTLHVHSGDVIHSGDVVQSRDVVPVPACPGTRCPGRMPGNRSDGLNASLCPKSFSALELKPSLKSCSAEMVVSRIHRFRSVSLCRGAGGIVHGCAAQSRTSGSSQRLGSKPGSRPSTARRRVPGLSHFFCCNARGGG